MEYKYINDIDQIISDKDKLKDVILFLLKKSSEKYDTYSSKQLYETFCNESFDNFIQILKNMSCYEYRVECFNEHITDFHKNCNIDLKKKIVFIINQNYKIIDDSFTPISFEEYLFKCKTNDVKECIKYMIEYYEEFNELDVLQDKIEHFETLLNKESNDIWFPLNLKYIINNMKDTIKSEDFIKSCKKILKKYKKENKYDSKLFRVLWNKIK
jgi:hypothetical protein